MLHSRLRPLPRKGGRSAPKQSDNNNNPKPDFSDINQEDDNDEDEDEDAEDVFAAFLPHLLPDDAPQFHGDPGQLLQYDSPLYGPLTIMVPHYPEQNDDDDRNAEIATGLREDNTTDSNGNQHGNRIQAVNKVDGESEFDPIRFYFVVQVEVEEQYCQ